MTLKTREEAKTRPSHHVFYCHRNKLALIHRKFVKFRSTRCILMHRCTPIHKLICNFRSSFFCRICFLGDYRWHGIEFKTEFAKKKKEVTNINNANHNSMISYVVGLGVAQSETSIIEHRKKVKVSLRRCKCWMCYYYVFRWTHDP